MMIRIDEKFSHQDTRTPIEEYGVFFNMGYSKTG
jgi:hypothetical protein